MSHRSRPSAPRLLFPSLGTLALLALLILTSFLLPSAALAQEGDASPPADPAAADPATADPATADPAATDPGAVEAPPTYMPLVENVYAGLLGDRIGITVGHNRLDAYPTVNHLNAGWYLDWWSRPDPQRPRGIEYAQMVRVHQRLTCPIGTTPDRNICPYAKPYSYTVDPSLDQIAKNARANPGSMWLVGNEIDRRDWRGGHQDEILPEVYAVAYHDIYHAIKGADPTAQVAIGGVIQMTELRARYLTKVWDSYRERYKTTMPVDIFNVHNFIGSERCATERIDGRQQLVCYIMGVPPGESVMLGAYYGEDWRHTDRATFDQQIRRMRQWMKDRGQMDKPLIVTEYGVLTAQNLSCPHPQHADPRLRASAAACYAANPSGTVPLTDASYVHDFMLWTFDYFLNTKDCALSATDDCRLVQRWAWFSLDASTAWGFNAHGQLFDPGTRQMLPAGYKFGQWAADNYQALQLEP